MCRCWETQELSSLVKWSAVSRKQARVEEIRTQGHQLGKAQEIGDFLNPVVIFSWKNQESSDTTRVVNFSC